MVTPQVTDFPLSFRSLDAGSDSRLRHMGMTAEKADAMRGALAFVRAISKQQMGDAAILLRGMIDGGSRNDPTQNFANAMCVMATLLCNELPVDDEWLDLRLGSINWLEAHPEHW